VTLSVIIPALNEASSIGSLLEFLKKELNRGDELIVVDGGSIDETVQIAYRAGARVIGSKPGRGLQQNAGAQGAFGEILWFVHADTRVPSGAVSALKASQGRWGCFGVRIEAEQWRLRWAGRYMQWRAELTGSCTGDMGLWFRREFFEELGGFAPWKAFEDLDLSDRARAREDCTLIPIRLGTSARRWKAQGINRTILKMWVLRVGWRLQLDPEKLAKWYQSNPRS
jgi:rSAM/selenodomain-associated transferase 2